MRLKAITISFRKTLEVPVIEPGAGDDFPEGLLTKIIYDRGDILSGVVTAKPLWMYDSKAKGEIYIECFKLREASGRLLGPIRYRDVRIED